MTTRVVKSKRGRGIPTGYVIRSAEAPPVRVPAARRREVAETLFAALKNPHVTR